MPAMACWVVGCGAGVAMEPGIAAMANTIAMKRLSTVRRDDFRDRICEI